MTPRQGKPRTLLADDEDDFRTVMRLWLAPHYEHADARDAAEFERRLAAHEPDVVILDLNLGGVGGAELCRRLRADARWKDLPVLFLSGSRESPRLKKQCPGVTSFLMKPISRDQLLGAVAGLLAGRGGGGPDGDGGREET
jgi:CheY-like chemotaxis protein